MGSENFLNGEELIIKQNRIIKDLPTKGLKEFSPNKSWMEKKQIEKKLEEKFDFVNTERIEKSNNLSVAEWIPHLGKAKVIKKIGKLWETIGHHQDNEDWLLPEEILFLVENCELQLILDNVSASVEECYSLLLQEELCPYDEYKVYSYLCRAGFRVIRHSPTITVTNYEQRVNLDTILQQSKRSPPSTSSVKLVDNQLMSIDEISILSDSSEKESGYNPEKKNISKIEVIEIEDDIDHSSVIEELLDSSDDSSDIICISSPSYTSSEHCRLWYPSIKQCLLRSMEKVIDLCNDDFPSDYKKLIHDKLDLIKISQKEVLSRFPSAENGVSIIHSPDSRLLPINVVPKYSEYKVNLNIRSDYNPSNNFKPIYNPMFKTPLTSTSNHSQINPELMTNPLLQKAEEMQAMTINMIQTMMSMLSSQNPNELWNFIDGRKQEMNFHPRFRDFQLQRPYGRIPRRNYRAVRRRYEKRGGGRYFRRFNEFNNYYDVDLHSAKDYSPEVKMETVVLSDDDEPVTKKDSFTGKINHSKRKRLDCDITTKKVKTESDFVSLLVLEEPNSNENKINVDISTQSVDKKISDIIVNTKDHIKEESCDFIDCIEVDEVVNRKQFEDNEKSKSGMALTSELNMERKHLETETSLINNQQSTSVTASNTFKSLDCSEESNTHTASSKIQDIHYIDRDKRYGLNFGLSSCNNTNQDVNIIDVDLCKQNKLNIISHTENVCTKSSLNPKVMATTTINTLNDEIMSWEEYKNVDDSLFNAEEGYTNTVFRFDDCSKYDDILSALQIFKAVNSTGKRKKNKITYDVYLPGTSFRKTLKMLPNFRVIILKSSEELPTPLDLQCLKTEYQDQIPFLFTIVFNETVGFYLYDNISLPPVLE